MTDWTKAACIPDGPTWVDLWFDPCATARPRETAADRAARIAEAKAVCSGCPIRDQCAEYATTERLDEGIYGGLSAQSRIQRRAIQPAAAKPFKHGTPGGAGRHRRNKEPVCDPCREAQREANRAYQRARQAKGAA